jgi:hypothetical protein
MSNPKNAIQEIKSLMVKFGFLTEEPSFQSFKLEDNTIIEAVKLENGENIFKINEAFERVSLEDGAYSIEDFEVEVADGKIANVKENFTKATLKDGTPIVVKGGGLEQGAKIYVVGSDGSETPAPDGVHELVDGTKITVKDGEVAVVESVGQQNAPDAENPAEQKGESPADEGQEEASPVDKETTKADSKVSPAQMEEVYNMLKDFVHSCNAKLTEMESSYSALSEQFEAFKKEPAGKKITYAKTDNFSKISEEDDLDARIQNLMSLRKINKK